MLYMFANKQRMRATGQRVCVLIPDPDPDPDPDPTAVLKPAEAFFCGEPMPGQYSKEIPFHLHSDIRQMD